MVFFTKMFLSSYRFATWACMTAEEFGKAVMKMEKMSMPSESCHDDK